MKAKLTALALIFSLGSFGVAADEGGFLSDYSKLTDGGDTGFTRAFMAPGATNRIANLESLMVDQPEIFIDPKSKYKGIKPGDAEVVAEALRAAFIEGLGSSVTVTDEPGENTALISWAITNIRLDKPKRRLVSYTPVGIVGHSVKKQMSDIVDKTRAFDVVFEMEGRVTDSEDVLFAMVEDLAEAGVEAKWGDALLLAEGIGKRVGCRINNTKLAVEDRVNCLSIPIED